VLDVSGPVEANGLEPARERPSGVAP
jgi:hypothetical protein